MLYHRLVLVLVLVCGGCATAGPLPDAPDAAGGWSDVELPSLAIPDGSSFMFSTVPDAQSVVDPSSVCGADAASDDADPMLEDAGGASDAGDGGSCPDPLALGDLVFDEVMIATKPGESDKGQWLEVRNSRSCSVDLIGLHAQAPRGSSFHTLDVTTDLWVPAGGYFLIADSLDPTLNNNLPGLVLAWSDGDADALHKTDDTVTLSVGAVTIDSLTYKAKEGLEAISMAFPANCAADLRGDFSNWRESSASWTPGLYGTPSAPNTDVRCSVAPPPLCAAGAAGRRHVHPATRP
jgi:hypothetical protein